MDFRVQRLHPPVHDFGKAGMSDTSRTARPASRSALAVPPVDRISTPRSARKRGERHQSGLVGNRNQGAADDGLGHLHHLELRKRSVTSAGTRGPGGAAPPGAIAVERAATVFERIERVGHRGAVEASRRRGQNAGLPGRHRRLGGMEDLLEHLFAGAQPGEGDLDVDRRAAGRPAGSSGGPDRRSSPARPCRARRCGPARPVAHAAGRGLQHQLHRLAHGHEIARHLGMGDGDRAAGRRAAAGTAAPPTRSSPAHCRSAP